MDLCVSFTFLSLFSVRELVSMCVCRCRFHLERVFYILSLSERDITPLREMQTSCKSLTHTCNNIKTEKAGIIAPVRTLEDA